MSDSSNELPIVRDYVALKAADKEESPSPASSPRKYQTPAGSPSRSPINTKEKLMEGRAVRNVSIGLLQTLRRAPSMFSIKSSKSKEQGHTPPVASTGDLESTPAFSSTTPLASTIQSSHKPQNYESPDKSKTPPKKFNMRDLMLPKKSTPKKKTANGRNITSEKLVKSAASSSSSRPRRSASPPPLESSMSQLSEEALTLGLFEKLPISNTEETMPNKDSGESSGEVISAKPITGSHTVDYDIPERFQSVVSAINFENLLSEALYYRQCSHDDYRESTPLPPNLSVSLHGPPIFGSSNLLYTLLYSDGYKAILRIPGNATTTYNKLDETVQQIAAMTISCLNRVAAPLPVPRLLGGVTGSDDIGVPFIMLSHSPGQPLRDVWPTLADHTRLQLLTNLAGVIAKISTVFAIQPQIGSPCYSTAATPGPEIDSVGPLYTPDLHSYQQSHTFAQLETYYPDSNETFTALSAPPDWPTTTSFGPFPTLSSLLTAPIPFHSRSTLQRGLHQLLGLIIDSIPHAYNPVTAVMMHPNLAESNILVDKDGQITALLDWDGVHLTHPMLGPTAFPAWICTDWTHPLAPTASYDTNSDSAADLRRYRAHYVAQFSNPEFTRNSHIVRALYHAATNSSLADTAQQLEIIQKVLDYAYGGRAQVPFDLEKYAFELGAEGVLVEGAEVGGVVGDRERLEELGGVKKAVGAMWRRSAGGWELHCWGFMEGGGKGVRRRGGI